jgi:hypothetical protein
VVLDLTGNGIKITQLSSSDTYFDMTGSGVQNLTAWAGAGNGVLFFDPTGAGQLTQANQVVFTDWDRAPSPTCRRCLTCSTPITTARLMPATPTSPTSS